MNVCVLARVIKIIISYFQGQNVLITLNIFIYAATPSTALNDEKILFYDHNRKRCRSIVRSHQVTFCPTIYRYSVCQMLLLGFPSLISYNFCSNSDFLHLIDSSKLYSSLTFRRLSFRFPSFRCSTQTIKKKLLKRGCFWLIILSFYWFLLVLFVVEFRLYVGIHVVIDLDGF